MLFLGERWKNISFFDLNSMYPYTFKKRFPCGLGFEWTLNKTILYKKLMTTQKISMGSVEWLDYMSNDERLINSNGERAHIISGWNSREVKLGPYKVDGYCQVDDICYVFEYDGCNFHKCKECSHIGIGKVINF